jgi:hypothetical protein
MMTMSHHTYEDVLRFTIAVLCQCQVVYVNPDHSFLLACWKDTFLHSFLDYRVCLCLTFSIPLRNIPIAYRSTYKIRTRKW